jgi:hypothetical protein
MSKALKNRDKEKKQSKEKRLIEIRINEAVVHLHLQAQHTWPQLSVCLSCILSVSLVTPS